ncbi:MAG: sodium/solute symporter [Acidobacteria bacterium]|nr:sodium/solute symporter [Acidobacteriota bacterium]MCI0722550.1 sodium/solute symporter [Acidobacteriota bacterium]
MTGFTWIDYAILILYIAMVTAIGSCFAKGQTSSKDFFLAGRNVGWLPMTLSVIATDFSAISFLGVPGYVVAHDLQLELMQLVFLWTLPLALFLFVRLFYRLELISAYEYLERRFNLQLRTVCSLLFICLRLCWMATALYATSLALTEVMNIPFWVCVLLMGGFTTLYSALGGMKAVIWTDVAQFFVFSLAIFSVLAKTMNSVPGGVIAIWQIAQEHGHTRLVSFEGGWESLTTPAILIGGSFLVLISYGVDQVVIQRYFSAQSVTAIKRGMVFQACFTPIMIWSLALIGLAVFSFYAHFPGSIPLRLSPDRWFPYFIVHELPTGLSGLVVAGLFAATMSSISGGVNSLTAAYLVDFYRRFRHKGPIVSAVSVGAASAGFEEDRRELRISRVISLFWGAAASGLALVVGRIGVIAIIAKTMSGFFGGVLLGVFLLGMLVPRANGQGAFLGGTIGFLTICSVGLGSSINLFWYAPIGCLVTFLCGVVLSQFFSPPRADKLNGLTLKTY